MIASRFRPAWISILGSLLLSLGMLRAWSIPVITSVSPGSGAPGTSVQIEGAGFTDAMEVKFDLSSAIFTVVSDQRLVATVPLDATSGPVSVTDFTGATAVTFGHFLVAPRITEFSPTSASPGAVVTIEGFNLEGATAILINGTNTNFRVNSPTQAQAVVPVGATSGPISITTPVGVARTRGSFTVTANEPFITSISPTRGAPGDQIKLEGLNFSGVKFVKFGSLVSGFAVNSSSQIQTEVPVSAATGPISIATAFGTNVTDTVFVVTTAPLIDDFTPFGGPAGTSVVINGANFVGATAVRFAGKPAQFTVTAATQMQATVPAGATNGPITVVTARGTGQSSDDFLASSGPIITEFNPSFGPPGSLVTVTGINLDSVTAAKINGVNAGFNRTAPTQLSITVPGNASSGPISLTSPAGTATTPIPFLVRTGKPFITGFDPEAGAQRAIVTIEGLDFTGTTAVRFNGVPANYSVVADTQISVLVPDTATSGLIQVSTPSGTVTSSNRFVVAPRLVSLAPTNGIAGTVVTIRGTNFADLIAVRFRDIPASVQTVSSNVITAVVPNEAVSGSVNVITPAGIVASTNVFLVLPTITDFTPVSGQAGSPITVFGTGFADVIAVQFNGIASAFAVQSSTEILALVPAQASSGPITVVTLAGTGSSTRSFTVGSAADVAVSQTVSTNRAVENQALTYTLSVTNRGTATATEVVLTNTLPASVIALSLTASQGSISQRGSVITARLGTLTNRASASVSLTILPMFSGSLTNTTVVAAKEQDPDLSNNSSSLVVQVDPSSAELLIEESSATNLRISWPVAAGNLTLQSTTSLKSPAVWQAVNAVPVVIGDRRTVTVPATGPPRFYRLMRP